MYRYVMLYSNIHCYLCFLELSENCCMVSCLYIVHCSSLFQPVACEGQIETWLSSFVSSLKGSLQFQMATALGYEKPRPKRRTIRSAGSRKVSVPVRASSSLSKQNKGWWSQEFCPVGGIVCIFSW